MKNLNILLISPDFNYCCGRSKYFYLLSKYLTKRGHKVHFITNGGDSLERLNNLSIEQTTIKRLHSLNPFHILTTLIRLKKLINFNNIDVVHTNHRMTEILITLLRIFSKCKAKSVITVLSILKRKYGIEYKSEHIIAVSQSVKNNLIRIFSVNPSHITVIPHFIEDATASNNHDIDSEKRIIFSAGRFHPEKNYIVLLKAVNRIPEENLKVVLIGQGKEKKLYKDYARLNNIDLEIIEPMDDLSELFNKSTLCVLPSSTDPFPHFMLETGIHKKPFIGSDVDGMGELIIEKINGLKFENNNDADLAEKIKLFLNNEELAVQCSDNLFDTIKRIYSPDNIIKQIEDLYYQALS
jgi:glycosyltransferase involved in cell wall biosynthesis